MLQETEVLYERVTSSVGAAKITAFNQAVTHDPKNRFQMYIKTHVTRNYFLDQNNTKVVVSEVKKFVPEVKIVIPPKVDKNSKYCIGTFMLVNYINMYIAEYHQDFEMKAVGFSDDDHDGGDNVHRTDTIRSYVEAFGEQKEVIGSSVHEQMFTQTFGHKNSEGLDTAIVVDLGERKDRQGKPKNDLSISFKTNMPELFKGKHSLKIIMEHKKTTP